MIPTTGAKKTGKPKRILLVKPCCRCGGPQWAGGLCRPCAQSFGTWNNPR